MKRSVKNVNQRLKRLIETGHCQAEIAEEYHKDLLNLAKKVADTRTAKKKASISKHCLTKKGLE